MEGTYEINSASKVIGTVVVKRQGLYYQFACRCKLSGDVMFRLIMQCDGAETDLGILTPMDGCFGVNTRINGKKLGRGSVQFLLRPKRDAAEQMDGPFSPDEPFAYLSKLEYAYLCKRNGKSYIAFHNEK